MDHCLLAARGREPEPCAGVNPGATHDDAVRAWLRVVAPAATTPALADEVLAVALRALWQRALGPLGSLTLYAIVRRVLADSRRKFPVLDALSVTPSGIALAPRGPTAAPPPRDELLAAARFVVLEFLTVLGSLTGEILTPALHDELSKITPEGEGADDTAVMPKRARARRATPEEPEK